MTAHLVTVNNSFERMRSNPALSLFNARNSSLVLTRIHRQACLIGRTPATEVFSNLDLMENIFRNFYERGNLDIPSPAACLRLAMLVSKTFFAPARNVLWRSIPSLSPVLRILSSDSEYRDSKSLEVLEVTSVHVRAIINHLFSGEICLMN